MPYRYATSRIDYADYASGCVLHGTPGHPAFPVRLASEIYLACWDYRVKNGNHAPCTLYDPVCGGCYHLSVLALLHWETIRSIVASDIDNEILSTAQRNLQLISPEGINIRIKELQALVKAYGRQSHLNAVESAIRLREKITQNDIQHKIKTFVFCADALNSAALVGHFGSIKADIVIADVPYGIHSSWVLSDKTVDNPIKAMLANLLPVLSERAIVAVAADKKPKITHPLYSRLDKFQIGKRQIVILTPTSGT